MQLCNEYNNYGADCNKYIYVTQLIIITNSNSMYFVLALEILDLMYVH